MRSLGTGGCVQSSDVRRGGQMGPRGTDGEEGGGREGRTVIDGRAAGRERGGRKRKSGTTGIKEGTVEM